MRRQPAPAAEARKRQPAARADTRTVLLRAAEKLFARHGVDNVTLIDIGKSARQRNRSAAQYHFGTRQALLDAILERHRVRIGARREKHLQAMRDSGRPTLNDAVKALVMPVAACLGEADGGREYLLISSQIVASGKSRAAAWAKHNWRPEVQELQEIFAVCLPDVGAERLRVRSVLAVCMLFHGLSMRVAQEICPVGLFVEELVAAIEAVYGGKPVH